MDNQESEYRGVTKSLKAEVAKLEVQLQEREKQAGEFKQLVVRLEQEVSVVRAGSVAGIVAEIVAGQLHVWACWKISAISSLFHPSGVTVSK